MAKQRQCVEAPGRPTQRYPDKFEVDSKRIRILDGSASPILAEQLAQRILDGELPEFSHVAGQEARIREAMLQYVLEAEPTTDAVVTMEASFPEAHDNQTLLLLRGLLGRGVLSHSLQKRWKVNYGRAHDRAKDTPARQAEFSHPDVVIILTCLSYYSYGGLSPAELASDRREG
ncbi:hypothetical protein B0T25DRAFT_519278 [Lasiosphaeria hispida]|uniref:ubiquitinyl hydrolase 1 n=1 Tax=Lasiosphaeria hispida TaxID=260671 RepID=A0AAJ0MBT9_9PEZI|nr:hypothetical protein B0T25DRAFT_519278 [Lasiosphaeria hispida]